MKSLKTRILNANKRTNIKTYRKFSRKIYCISRSLQYFPIYYAIFIYLSRKRANHCHNMTSYIPDILKCQWIQGTFQVLQGSPPTHYRYIKYHWVGFCTKTSFQNSCAPVNIIKCIPWNKKCEDFQIMGRRRYIPPILKWCPGHVGASSLAAISCG